MYLQLAKGSSESLAFGPGSELVFLLRDRQMDALTLLGAAKFDIIGGSKVSSRRGNVGSIVAWGELDIAVLAPGGRVAVRTEGKLPTDLQHRKNPLVARR